jgi:hypothetical protein
VFVPSLLRRIVAVTNSLSGMLNIDVLLLLLLHSNYFFHRSNCVAPSSTQSIHCDSCLGTLVIQILPCPHAQDQQLRSRHPCMWASNNYTLFSVPPLTRRGQCPGKYANTTVDIIIHWDIGGVAGCKVLTFTPSGSTFCAPKEQRSGLVS